MAQCPFATPSLVVQYTRCLTLFCCCLLVFSLFFFFFCFFFLEIFVFVYFCILFNYNLISNAIADHLPYYRNAKYVFKTDDDMWMNLSHINKTVDQIITNNQTFYGNCFGSGYPHRSPTSKWYTPYRFYPHRWYGSFCLGSALLMQSRAVQNAAHTAGKVPYFHVEDVYISGGCFILTGSESIQHTVVKKRNFPPQNKSRIFPI